MINYLQPDMSTASDAENQLDRTENQLTHGFGEDRYTRGMRHLRAS